VSQENKSKERKFVWVGTTILHIEFLGMSNKWRETWSSCIHGGRILENYGVYLELETEEPGF